MADPGIDQTQSDGLVAYTDNGLRPEDAALPQPPQDPASVLDAQGNPVAG
jgi:hypothetical protein